MPLIYITGVAGSGKSAVCKEFVARGYEAYDTDKDNLTVWIDKETGLEVFQPKEEWGCRTQEWYDRHEWKLSIPKVKGLTEQNKDKHVFLCGTVSNRGEIIDLADITLCLSVDENVLVDRISTRKNMFGNNHMSLIKF